MDEPEQVLPYQRLQQLLAIPERQRTEAQWDEINELEIALTPVNRSTTPDRNIRRKGAVQGAAPPEQPRSREGTPGRRPLKKLRKRPPKAGGS
ncbi:hypothetical protein [Nitrosospira multiformis]|uniref:hypothetical protein n=1 Tax=Nitrosospira multiformis TaxID=1231 RepID=UPI000944FF2E|nr:hypothetical protein [Nitrosospira multiformis]